MTQLHKPGASGRLLNVRLQAHDMQASLCLPPHQFTAAAMPVFRQWAVLYPPADSGRLWKLLALVLAWQAVAGPAAWQASCMGPTPMQKSNGLRLQLTVCAYVYVYNSCQYGGGVCVCVGGVSLQQCASVWVCAH